jgi:acetoacetyl-CoA synthetase
MTASERGAGVPRPAETQIAEFRAVCARHAGRDLSAWQDLHGFSIDQADVFWRLLLDWADLPWSGSADVVLFGDEVETARFFPRVRLNHAEVLLRALPEVDDEAPALTGVHVGQPDEVLSRRDLREAVRRTATTLAFEGIATADRVVLVAPNTVQAVVAALGVTALGATLSTATPDLGTVALIGRLAQVEPVLLLLDRTGMPDEVVHRLVEGLPSLRRVLLLDDEQPTADFSIPLARLADVVATHCDDADAAWPRVPWDSPLFVMFSSGTTGRPKAIVHGVGGTLLEHIKEHRLHGDLRSDDTMYFHTTTAWMMWHWQLSALAVGAHVVVYDGPLDHADTLWRLASHHRVTVFGTSPAYLQLCQDAGYRPAEDVDLSSLRAVLSTGAVLHDWQFDWVAQAVGQIPLQSISGGTDIIGCFVLGHPEAPVRRGRSQSRSLGMDVAAVDRSGRALVGQIGDLVCRRPFPSRPVGFLGDPDGSRFHRAYFTEHPGMWTHGDLVEFDSDGTARLHGRSDGVLNVNGVRIGPSEIYTILRRLPEVVDALAVEQRDPQHPGESRMVLLVVLQSGHSMDGPLARTIRRTLRRDGSAAHVPSVVVAVPELPQTHNGKRSEKAVSDAVNGSAVTNIDALRNPGCLDDIRTALRQAVGGERGDAADAARASQPVEDAVGRDLLERLSRIWCEVLDLPEADPADELSDVGGTSRQAVRLLRRVALEVGVEVPVSAFYARPTLTGLAAAVAAGQASGTVRVPLLRSGTGDPLHLVADYLGQLNSYHRLVQSLTTERPVYGLMPSVFDKHGGRRPIADVVEETLSLLQASRPSGPYRLLGYSFGGLVAFEVAGRLRAAGETVAYLGLLDVHPPEVLLTTAELRAKRAATATRRLRTALSRRGLTAARRYADRRRTFAVNPKTMTHLKAWALFNAYRPSCYEGAVTYYLARQRLPFVGNTLAAWRRIAPHLLVTEVPGNHPFLLDQANIDELAAHVSTTLV